MHSVDLTAHAARDLRKLADSIYSRIRSKLLALADNPRPTGCRKIHGEMEQYRIRAGAYRILYSVDDKAKAVTVQRIAARKEAYRKND